MLHFEPVEPDRRAPVPQLRLRELAELEKVRGVPSPEILGATGISEPLECELADRLQHPEALVRMAQQALVDKRLQRVQVCVADALGRFHRAAACEHREPGEEPLLLVGEELIAPLDGGPQRPLARVGVAATPQQIEPLRESFQDLARAEHARSRRGQLDGQGQIVQAGAELCDLLARLQTGAGTEELDRLGAGQRRHRVVDLAADPQQLPARHQEAEIRARLDQRAEHRRGFHHLLEVVQQQEQLTFANMLGQAVLGAQRLGDGLGDEGRVAQGGQTDPEDAAPKLRHQLCRRFDCESCLPRTARAGQRHQSRTVLQQLDHLCHLPLAAHKRRRWPRQVRIRNRLQRWKPLLTQLEDPHRLREVLQPVLAEVGQIAVNERPRCCGQHYLSAVARGSDASGPVQLAAGIAFARQPQLAGVQPHPHLYRARRERLLALICGGQRLPRIGKDVEKRVPLRVDLHAAMRGERDAQNTAVLRERPHVGFFAELVDQPRRALDVSEEQCDGATW